MLFRLKAVCFGTNLKAMWKNGNIVLDNNLYAKRMFKVQMDETIATLLMLNERQVHDKLQQFILKKPAACKIY